MILLDTHTLLWWIENPKKLSAKAVKKIEDEKKAGEILISSITIWEICMLIKKGKIGLTMDVDSWVKQLEGASYLRFIPVDNKIAAASVDLVGVMHGDPADRMIVATALQFGAKLITSDQKILQYPHVQTVW